MIAPSEAEDRCADLVARARRAGADGASAHVSAESSLAVDVRLGALEDVSRSESEELALTVHVGRRKASVRSSDFAPAALEELAARAVDMARASPEDPYAGPAPADLLARVWPADLDLADLDLADGAEPGPETLRERALECEDAARAVAGITNSNGAGGSFQRSTFALATSEGFAGSYEGTLHSISASMIAGEGSAMQRNHDYRVARHAGDLPDPAGIGASASERTVRKLDPQVPKGGTMPVVFDSRVGSSLVGHILGAIGGPAHARRATFMLDRMQDAVFAPGIVLREEPHRPRGLRSSPFDGEGLPRVARSLVVGGYATGLVTNLASARQLQTTPSGNGAAGGGISVGNLHIEAGEETREAMIADIADGIYVTELIGQGVNMVTGTYSRGAAGYRIAGGEIAGPLAEFTIAGNLVDMFGTLRAANDLAFDHVTNVPSLRVDGMVVAGA